MILQILGVIFLIILCVVAFLGWKFYRMVKSQANSDIAVAMSVLPSQFLDLEPSSKDVWKEQERLEYSESELKKMGASHVGYYCVYHGEATIKVSLWDFKQQAVAALYEASSIMDENNASYIFEVACKLSNGTVCISSNPHAPNDSRPAQHRIKHHSSNSIIEFIQVIKQEIPEGSKLIKIVDPKAFFIDCYEDIAEWNWQEAQLRSSKTQQVFASLGIDVNEELMEQLIDMGKSYAVELNVERARKNLAKHSKISAQQWESMRDRLVIVNELMGVEELLNAVYSLQGDFTEAQEQVIEGFENNNQSLNDPISAFQMLIQALNIDVKKLTSMEKPVKTEIYLPKN